MDDTSHCRFCTIQSSASARVIATNELAFAVRDAKPVTQHHTLVIPKRHVRDLFSITYAKLTAIFELIHEQSTLIQSEDPAVEGFNIGSNVGKQAGQTVWHCHFHVIPRRRKDVDSGSKGGLRRVVPRGRQYGFD